MPKWTIRNYNAFIREVRAQYGVDLQTARQAYRDLRDKLGRSCFGADVKRHPVLTSRAVKSAERKVREERKKVEFRLPDRITSVQQWLSIFNPKWLDSPPAIFEGTARYHKKSRAEEEWEQEIARAEREDFDGDEFPWE
jgi:hypothetical protein